MGCLGNYPDDTPIPLPKSCREEAKRDMICGFEALIAKLRVEPGPWQKRELIDWLVRVENLADFPAGWAFEEAESRSYVLRVWGTSNTYENRIYGRPPFKTNIRRFMGL